MIIRVSSEECFLFVIRQCLIIRRYVSCAYTVLLKVKPVDLLQISRLLHVKREHELQNHRQKIESHSQIESLFTMAHGTCIMHENSPDNLRRHHDLTCRHIVTPPQVLR